VRPERLQSHRGTQFGEPEAKRDFGLSASRTGSAGIAHSDEINRRVARGRLTVKISMHAANGSWPGQVKLNAALARAYARELNRLAKELKLAGPVTLETLVRAPGVLQTDEELSDAESFWPAVAKALRKALAAHVKMREREGAHLAKDLQKRMAVVARSVERVQEHAPEVVKHYQEQLRERIKNAGLEMPDVGDDRLLKEIVYFADRSDISEELTRLQSHFQQFDDCVKSKSRSAHARFPGAGDEPGSQYARLEGE